MMWHNDGNSLGFFLSGMVVGLLLSNRLRVLHSVFAAISFAFIM